MWEIILGKAVEILAPTAITVVTSFVSVGLYQLQKFVKSKTNSQEVSDKVAQFDSIVEMIVKEAEQIVRPMLSDGKLTLEEKRKIKLAVIKRIHKIVPGGTKEVIEAISGQLNSYISAKIEQKVLEMKHGNNSIS